MTATTCTRSRAPLQWIEHAFMRLKRIHPAMTAGEFFRQEFALPILAMHGLVECPVIDGIRHWIVSLRKIDPHC